MLKSVLITGGSGLVGAALQRAVSNAPGTESWVFLSSADGDLTDETAVRRLFETHRPTVVVHLAANVGGLFKNMNQPVAMLEDNLLMNTLVLKYARLHRVEKIISILSTCIFPDQRTDGVLEESMLHDGAPHPSNEGYAYAKRMMEVQTRLLSTGADGIGCVGVSLIPTNLYGPGDTFDLENAHVLPALIHRCALAIQRGEPFRIKGSGAPIRQFLFVDDFARQILWAVRQASSSGCYMCSPPSTEAVSILELGTTIARLMGYEGAVQTDPGAADGQTKKVVEPHAVFRDWNYTPLEEGLKRTIASFV